MKRIKNSFLALAILLILFSCAGNKQSLRPIDSDSALIGISLTTRGPVIKSMHFSPDRVYFVKLDSGQDLYSQKTIIRSNYKKDGVIYLLNAEPGRYVAVAYLDKRTSPGIGAPVEMQINLFLSKELIEMTEVSVEPGTIAFMGEYRLDQAGLKGRDEAQLFYSKLISGGIQAKATLYEAKRDRKTEIIFLHNAMKNFEDKGWVPMIQKRLQALETHKELKTSK